ncbi:MAG TPA: serine/threonine-protein kinase [Actinomycetota bacterium]|jgi:serine/threonine-protein kinase|nr:serine/threonine-protein kinase [Actinomycetota bacterium]
MSQPLPPFPYLLAGRYELSEPLASGQTTSVWRAHDRVLGRDVIVKLLRPELAAQPEVRDRFRQEAVSAARLAHPNIVAVYDTGEQQGVDYLVMELVQGPTLAQTLHQYGPMPAGEAARVALQVAQGLAYAHQAGVPHRNLTPNNILLGLDGTVKLGDFSIGAATQAEGDPGRTGELPGPLPYLAPELIDGQEPDVGADLYGLGACLYEMLTGRPPPPGPPVSGRQGAQWIMPRAVRADVPRELDLAVQRAMAPDPADRYPTAETMVAALASAANEAEGGFDSLSLTSPNPPPLTEVAPGPGFLRHEGRWLGWTLALVGMAAAVALVGMALSHSVRLDLHLPTAGTHAPSSRPASTATAPSTPVRFSRALAFDPLGDGNENDDQASQAIDQDAATAWTTQHYNRPALGGLKPGVGLVLDAGHAVGARELDLTLQAAGGSLEVYGASGDASPAGFPDGWTRLAATAGIRGRQQRLTLTGQGSYRWYLVWFTSLPPAPDDPGRYQDGITEALLGPPS